MVYRLNPFTGRPDYSGAGGGGGTGNYNFSWIVVAGTSQQMGAQYGYICTNAALTTVTLPATAVPGAEVQVNNAGGGFRIAQNANQQILLASVSTTVGVTGYLESTNPNDTIRLVCISANNIWQAFNCVGNFNLV